jgi:hypothetical protein
MAIIVTRATSALTSGTGTITTSTSSTTVTGVSTLFTTEIDYAGKALYTSADVYIGTISAIASNTSLTLTANAAVAVSGAAYKIGYLPKNSPLSNAEIDTNFINLNNNKLEFSDTTAVNLANSVVRRDGSGNFAAATISAALNGNASTATTLQTTRKINNIDFNGSADILTPTIFDAAYTRVVNPGGGYVGLGANQTGAIAITLPVGWSDSFITMTVRVYEYSTGKTFDVVIAGYYMSATWTNNPTAFIVGNPGTDRRFSVRYGYNTVANKGVIYIGELASTWQYPTVSIIDCQFGWNGKQLAFTSGWSIGLESTAFQNVTATIASTNIQVGYGVSTNTANTVVQRDASGNFSAGTITATLSGTASALVTSSGYQVGALGVGTAASGTTGEIRATNAITSYYSDERLKENIAVIENALDKVQSLSGVTYNANSIAESYGFTDKSKQVGVLAQQVKQVLPEAVKPAPFDILQLNEGIEISRSGENYMTVQYEKLVPLLIQAVKELKEQVDQLKGVK